MEIRRYKQSDCKELSELFYNTVHNVNAKDYTEEQLNVWATGQVDLKNWNLHFTHLPGPGPFYHSFSPDGTPNTAEKSCGAGSCIPQAGQRTTPVLFVPSYCEEIDRRGYPSHALYVNVCRVIRRHDRPAAHPRHGNM